MPHRFRLQDVADAGNFAGCSNPNFSLGVTQELQKGWNDVGPIDDMTLYQCQSLAQ